MTLMTTATRSHRPGATVKFAPQGTAYNFRPGTYYLLDSNAVICADQSPFSGAHSDIRHPEVIWAVVDASGRPGRFWRAQNYQGLGLSQP